MSNTNLPAPSNLFPETPVASTCAFAVFHFYTRITHENEANTGAKEYLRSVCLPLIGKGKDGTTTSYQGASKEEKGQWMDKLWSQASLAGAKAALLARLTNTDLAAYRKQNPTVTAEQLDAARQIYEARHNLRFVFLRVFEGIPLTLANNGPEQHQWLKELEEEFAYWSRVIQKLPRKTHRPIQFHSNMWKEEIEDRSEPKVVEGQSGNKP